MNQSQVKIAFVLSCLFFLIFPQHAQGQSAQPVPQEIQKLKTLFKQAKRFEDIYVFSRRIEFKSVDIIGEITQVEINRKGEFLIVDRLSKKVWLFDHDGNLLRDIGLEDSYPGVHWLPLGAWFSQNDRILVQIDRTHNLFLFDPAGKFVKAIPVFFPPQYKDFVLNEEKIYGYAADGPILAIKVMDYEGKILLEGGIFPEKFKSFIQRTPGGGLVMDANHFIYQFNSPEPNIYKWSPELKLVNTFKRNPPYYRRLQEDFPDFAGNPVSFMKKAGKILDQTTTTLFVNLLKHHFLLIQYFDPGNGIYLDICDLNGEYFTDHEIKYRIFKVAVFEDFVYDIYQPPETAPDEVPNPYLREYKLNLDAVSMRGVK